MQARQTAQVGGGGRGRQAFGPGRAAHHTLGAVAQNLHHHVRIFQWRKTHAQGDVEAFVNQVDPAIGALDK
ncbi:hypothetical protein D3C85_1712930 [compost metagenome]